MTIYKRFLFVVVGGGGWWTCTILYKQYCSCSFSTQNTSKLLVSVYRMVFFACAEITLYYTIYIHHNERLFISKMYFIWSTASFMVVLFHFGVAVSHRELARLRASFIHDWNGYILCKLMNQSGLPAMNNNSNEHNLERTHFYGKSISEN